MGLCKTQFGTFWQRLWRGGVRLFPLEERLLEALLGHMPTPFLAPLQAQLDAYNLAQRQVDGRALNLYRMKGRRVARDDLPPLPCRMGETKLLRFQAVLPNSEAIHVAFWAVDRYLFGFDTDRDIRPFGTIEQFEISHLRQSWRSAIEPASGDAAGEEDAEGDTAGDQPGAGVDRLSQ
jgi:hypothetical protein